VRLILNIARSALLAGLLTIGLASDPAATSPVAKQDAWLEAKPACVFPMGCDAMPPSGVAFAAALFGGLQRLAVIPPGAVQSGMIQIQSDAYPTFGSLRIDLSNSAEDDVHKPPKVNWHYTPKSAVTAAQFEVSASPLLIHGAKLEYDLTATDADLNLAEDRAGHPLLMLMGTTHGHFSATATRDTVHALCLAAAKRFATKYHFSVKDLAVDLTTPTDRSVNVVVDVALAGELGGSLHFTGLFEVADDLRATASHLTCTGDGPGGDIIAAMLTPGLMYYDGKTKPLVVFPFDAMTLRDVRFHMDDNLHIAADFGGKM
jgi:hypothetical protein